MIGVQIRQSGAKVQFAVYSQLCFSRMHAGYPLYRETDRKRLDRWALTSELAWPKCYHTSPAGARQADLSIQLNMDSVMTY